jgi:hypothetical protein
MVLNLVLREGAQRIAIGVRDDVAGVEATATLDVTLPLDSTVGEQDNAV